MGLAVCLLRKLSCGNNIYLMFGSYMENTAKRVGNTNTSVFPPQTRKGGAKWREAEPGVPPQVQGQAGLQSKSCEKKKWPKGHCWGDCQEVLAAGAS